MKRNKEKTDLFLDIPKNVTFTQRSFTPEQLQDILPADRGMIMNILTYCCYSIAKRHIGVETTVTLHEEIEPKTGIILKKYLIYASFPIDTLINSDHILDILTINPLFINPIIYLRDKEATSIAIPVFSTANPIAIEQGKITLMNYKRILIRTDDTEDDHQRGSVKKIRKAD